MSGANKASKRRKKLLIKATAVLVVLIVVLVAVVAWMAMRDSSDETNDDATKDATTQTIQTAQGLTYDKNYDQAATQTSKQYESAKDQDDKYVLALQTASIHETKGDCKAAIEWYQKAYGINQEDRGPASGLARCYDQQKDYARAVEFYRKTIDAIDPDQIGADNDIAHYQSLLNKAEAAAKTP